jgi:hypothetical protein
MIGSRRHAGSFFAVAGKRETQYVSLSVVYCGLPDPATRGETPGRKNKPEMYWLLYLANALERTSEMMAARSAVRRPARAARVRIVPVAERPRLRLVTVNGVPV